MAKKPFYSKTPAVPEKQIAGKNPIPGPALGEFAPPMAPMHPGRSKALGRLSVPTVLGTRCMPSRGTIVCQACPQPIDWAPAA